MNPYFQKGSHFVTTNSKQSFLLQHPPKFQNYLPSVNFPENNNNTADYTKITDLNYMNLSGENQSQWEGFKSSPSTLLLL